ncbi:MAG: hypothetical protein LUG25_06105 [Oscillospiraceae bacterium]|nr:hypothetical protein [Oscillospiraceae bacterium]
MILSKNFPIPRKKTDKIRKNPPLTKRQVSSAGEDAEMALIAFFAVNPRATKTRQRRSIRQKRAAWKISDVRAFVMEKRGGVLS